MPAILSLLYLSERSGMFKQVDQVCKLFSCYILWCFSRCQLCCYQFSLQEEVDMLLSRGKSLGVSNLRFMPKPSSLRAITNLSSAAKLDGCQFVQNQMGQGKTKPVNTQLFDLFSILKFEKVLWTTLMALHYNACVLCYLLSLTE